MSNVAFRSYLCVVSSYSYAYSRRRVDVLRAFSRAGCFAMATLLAHGDDDVVSQSEGDVLFGKRSKDAELQLRPKLEL